MTTYIALLRGINVSGQKKIKMQELIAVFESLGFKDAKTYIQSGNVIFTSAKKDKNELVSIIQEKIEHVFSFPVTVLLRTAHELQQIVTANPFLKGEGLNTSKLHITFLSDTPAESAFYQEKEPHDKHDEFVISGQEIYLHCPNGYGHTKYSNNYFEKKLGVTATTRNWKTVVLLLGIAEDRIQPL
jgi:uncharacterized protein (DUF1697 family)